MQLIRLRLAGLRNIAGLEIEPGPRLNVITGANGAGKTSILEAIYLLSHARSFRSPRNELLVTRGQREMSIFGIVERLAGSVRLGLLQSNGRLSAKVDGAPPPTLADMLRECAVVCFEPGSHALISGSSEERRSFIDWGVFHVEPNFVDVVRNYRRALQQRNALLRIGGAASAELQVWTEELIRSASPLVEARNRYLERFRTAVVRLLAEYLGELGEATFHTSRGWDQSVGFDEALAQATEIDRQRGFTSRGPHRMTWSLRFVHAPLREHLSRGQEKLCAIACMLAQAELFHVDRHEWPIIVLDDLASELDVAHQELVMRSLAASSCQFFVTGTESPRNFPTDVPFRQFHVEQGQAHTLL